MEIKINSQKRNVTVLPEAVASQKQEETQLADKRKRLDKNLVAGLVRKSNRILVTISTHKFPIDLFPDTINVEEGRVTVIVRYFFFSSQIHSVDIKDISNILINTSPFFAELVVVSKTFAENEIRINNLRKKEAIFARRIIEGLRTFENKQIDTSIYEKEELITKLKQLSTTEIVT
jgi:hypothetical protein